MLDSSEALQDRQPSTAGRTPGAPAAVSERRRRIVAFVNDEVSEAALRTGLAGIAEELDIKRGNVRQATRFFEKETAAQALVVDIAGISDPAAALEELSRVCPPDVLVTVVGDITDIGFYRLLVQGLGVTEYLPRPLTRDTVQTVLRPHLSGAEADPAVTRGGHLVAVCGAQGGAGATSIAVNLAVQLAATTKASVALLDLHLQDGEAAVMLGVRAGPGLRIALEEPMRADNLFLERMAIEIDQRLRLIAADEAMDADMQITEAGVRHLLGLVRQKYNFIVIDVPIPLPPAMRPVIALSRHVLVLLEAEVTGLRNACALRNLAHGIAGSNRVFTILNRADRSGGLSVSMIRKGLGAAPDLIIPDLGKRMTEAVNVGVPALHKVPALRRNLAPLVCEIAGVRSGGSKSWLRGWLRK